MPSDFVSSQPVRSSRCRLYGPFHRFILRALAAAACVLALGAAVAQPAGGPPEGGLPQLITAALAHHPSQQGAAALVAAARVGVAAARWQYYPTPSASVQALAASTEPTPGANRVTATIGLSQPLWTWGRLDAGVDRAQGQADAASAARAESAQQLALRVTQLYGEWRNAHARRLAYGEGLQVHERMLALVRRRADEGQAAATDVVLADSRLAALQADAAQADAQARSALDRLAVLTGRPLSDAALAAEPTQPWPLAEDWPALLARAEQVAPGLARLRAQATVVEAAVREQRARLLPELQARVEVARTAQAFGGSSASSTQVRAYIGISTQFSAGLSGQSAIDEAQARLVAAQAELQSERLALEESLRADHLQVAHAAARRADLVRAQGAAQGVLQSWDRQYLAGRKSWQELLNAAREDIQLRTQLADLDVVHLVASWRVALTAGLHCSGPGVIEQ
jgi:adhesin transport system outer membrane protein